MWRIFTTIILVRLQRILSMKAVIMAGGEGKRLKAVTGALPKPMVPLLGRPLMERCVELLVKNGITDICATLRYNPGPIMDYFGDGERFGVDITWRVETQPLGTAGSVKACMDVLGDAPFLVMSGDAACDFDIAALAREHEASGAAATVALYECREPLRYGLAVTDPDGDVRCFIEKPDWPRVVSNLVSTGIYVVSPHAMDYVPADTMFDFAADLFPLLLKNGERIHAALPEGYWCDVGTPRAYYQCCIDALDGRLSIPDAPPPPPEPEAKPLLPLPWQDKQRRRVPCTDRAKLMRAVSESLIECAAGFDDGVVIRSGHCAARISPEPDSDALLIETGAADAEFAGELAAGLERLVRSLDTAREA